MKTANIFTLGCKVNLFDSQTLSNIFQKHGYRVCMSKDARDNADIVVVNTCSVTGRADTKSRQLIKKMIKRYPRARIVVTGCATEYPENNLGKIDSIEKIFGVNQATALDKWLSEESGIEHSETDNGFRIIDFDYYNKSRAFIKVQDGCNQFCSYCVIPHLRGRSRSAKIAMAVKQVEKAVASGIGEVVLTGINLGDYGDSNSENLRILLMHITREFPEIRVRLSSIEPWTLNNELIDEVCSNPNICSHLHLPLQSGSDDILEKMRRPYTSKEFERLVLGLVDRMKGVCIGIDLIVGFPGEDEQAFSDSYNLLSSLPIAYIHAFPYSLREPTSIAATGDTTPSTIKKERCNKIINLSKQKRKEFLNNFIGKRVEVIFIKDSINGNTLGLSSNYIKVLVEDKDVKPKTKADVLLKINKGDHMLGDLIKRKRDRI